MKLRHLLNIFYFSFFLILSAFYSYSDVSAQDAFQGETGTDGIIEDKMIARPYPVDRVTPFLGQNHYYSFVFRGNGEAVVTAKIALTNRSESEDLNRVSLRLPVTNPEELTAYQIIGTGQCIRYDTPGFDQGMGGYYPPKCLEYGEPDYFSYWGESKYRKADTNFSGDTLVVNLPVSIKPQKSGAFFVYFRGFGITNKNPFGAYSYKIETFKTDDQINQVTIGINTDSDLYIKGGRGEVDYRFAEAEIASLKVGAGDMAAASPAIDNFLGNVGYGMITKQASNLAPLESYSVEGVYSKYRFSLYTREILIAVGVLLIFVIGAVVVVKKILRKLDSDGESGDIKEIPSKKSDEKSTSLKRSDFSLSVGISFISAFSIGLYTVFLMFAGKYLSGWGYQYQQFTMLFLVVISFCLYSALLFLPGIFLGIKKGVGLGISVIGLTILWLFILFLISLFVAFIILGDGNGGGGIYPSFVTKGGID